MKFFYFGTFDSYNLESSYVRAAKALGHDVKLFDYEQVYQQGIPYGRAGSLIARFTDVHQWLHQMNRKAIIETVAYEPDLFFVFCNAKILPGTLLYLRSVLPKTRFVLVWPDALNNMQGHVFAAAPLYDLMASYSRNALPLLQQIGFKHAAWIPLAGDPELHPASNSAKQVYDLSFVGNWRPEREEALNLIMQYFGKGFKLGVFGPSWNRRTQHKALKNIAVSKAVLGKEMADVFIQSKINLNRIDITNFPAANMRFFEIPTSGAFMLSSTCPEWVDTFIENQSVAYFDGNETLINKIKLLMNTDTIAMQQHAHQIIMDGHTYQHRIQSIIHHLS